MPRIARVAPGGVVYHVLNRSNARLRIFDKAADYAAFEKVVAETQQLVAVELFGYCLMPNHWHFVLRPDGANDLSRFMMRLTGTHVRRWHQHRGSIGRGHLYQGRYKSFPIQDDRHLLTVIRYVERNPLRAKLVDRAQEWRWASLARREDKREAEVRPRLAKWPLRRPRDWAQMVDTPLSATELEAVRLCTQRGRPYGQEDWVQRMAGKLGLGSTLRPRGRPAGARHDR